VAEIDALGITDLDSINEAQRRSILAAFVAKSIERRILNDIGANGFRVAGSPADIRQVHQELASYIQAATADQVSALLPRDVQNLSATKLESLGQEVYTVAWSILETYEAEPNASP
jgi:hypothetical protein